LPVVLDLGTVGFWMPPWGPKSQVLGAGNSLSFSGGVEGGQGGGAASGPPQASGRAEARANFFFVVSKGVVKGHAGSGAGGRVGVRGGAETRPTPAANKSRRWVETFFPDLGRCRPPPRLLSGRGEKNFRRAGAWAGNQRVPGPGPPVFTISVGTGRFRRSPRKDHQLRAGPLDGRRSWKIMHKNQANHEFRGGGGGGDLLGKKKHGGSRGGREFSFRGVCRSGVVYLDSGPLSIPWGEALPNGQAGLNFRNGPWGPGGFGGRFFGWGRED